MKHIVDFQGTRKYSMHFCVLHRTECCLSGARRHAVEPGCDVNAAILELMGGL